MQDTILSELRLDIERAPVKRASLCDGGQRKAQHEQRNGKAASHDDYELSHGRELLHADFSE